MQSGDFNLAGRPDRSHGLAFFLALRHSLPEGSSERSIQFVSVRIVAGERSQLFAGELRRSLSGRIESPRKEAGGDGVAADVRM